MNIKKLFSVLGNHPDIHGNKDLEISSISLDSREVSSGCCFFALGGSTTNGEKYIKQAIKKGAVAVAIETLPEVLEKNITYIEIKDINRHLGSIASHFYGNPSSNLKVIGVTGTNGKTTIATLVYESLSLLCKKAALLSTAGDYINGTLYEIPRTIPTTPDAFFIQKFFSDALVLGCEYVSMEVSSHSVSLHRVLGIHFACGIFTNLTHDHLDFHGTMEEYARAKQGFFNLLPASAYAVVNVDDTYGEYMAENSKANMVTYGFENPAQYFEIINSKLLGRFNMYNLLAVYSALVCLGFDKKDVLHSLSFIKAPRGRFELVYDENNIKAIVDYAHSPDAVQNALQTARDIREENGRVITIIGSGGDRDPFKRPLMARVAYDKSDVLILTSDNPRSEDPAKILADMSMGLPDEKDKEFYTIEDRKEAIKKARAIARAGDIIICLGKGHETYQEINGTKHHFDDREELQNAFQE
jgi:UDP-N-acetylmuramoyl-L-alanyl-D-glutamate--2,6-diaminopimelate ligase